MGRTRYIIYSLSLITAAVVFQGMRGAIPANPTPLKIIYPDYFGNRVSIPDDNPTTVEGVALGRMLFYETALSKTGSFSCGSCHRQELAFTDGKQFSEGVDGVLQPRNTMSLANLLWVRQFFWDGKTRGLEEQAIVPMAGVHEMGQSLDVSVNKLKAIQKYELLFREAFATDGITSLRIRQALAQFQRTLVSSNSKYDQYLRGEYQPTASELNGIALFFSNPDPSKGIRGAACGGCHGGPKTYTELFHNNGLDSMVTDRGRQDVTGQAVDNGCFRVVTLRNIALTAPYMYDGRFRTLDEVT